jgi:hypothetical protein
MLRKITHLPGKGFPFVLVLCLVATALVFAGCPTDSENKNEDAEFSGKWVSTGGDQFTIDLQANTFSYWYGSGEPSYGPESMDYKGDIKGPVLSNKNLLKNGSGYLAMQISSAGDWGPTVGKYIVIFWKDLTDKTVVEAGPYKAGGNNSGMDSVEAALAEYTVENGYFDMTGTYTK